MTPRWVPVVAFRLYDLVDEDAEVSPRAYLVDGNGSVVLPSSVRRAVCVDCDQVVAVRRATLAQPRLVVVWCVQCAAARATAAVKTRVAA